MLKDKRITIRITEETYNKLTEYAHQDRRYLSEWIRLIILEEIDSRAIRIQENIAKM